MSDVNRAVCRYKEGFSCSQAVLSTYAEQSGLSRQAALKVAAGFGGGMAMAETCGAVTGAFMVMGLKSGAVTAEDKASKKRTYELVREIAKEFKARNGSIVCKELLGCDISTPEGRKTAEDKGLFSSVCPKLVQDAAEILEEMLKQ